MSSVLVFLLLQRLLSQSRKTHFREVYKMQGCNEAFIEIGNGMRCRDDAFIASICGGQMPGRCFQCGAWCRDEEENTCFFYYYTCFCFRSYSQTKTSSAILAFEKTVKQPHPMKDSL